jgi:hypothetical protein
MFDFEKERRIIHKKKKNKKKTNKQREEKQMVDPVIQAQKVFCNRSIPRVTFLIMFDGNARTAKTPPLVHSLSAKSKNPSLSSFFSVKNPKHPNHQTVCPKCPRNWTCL